MAVAKALSPAVVQIETQEGLGSGVIYDSAGLILTNQHVVGSATSVSVNLSDGSKLTGTVVGADASSDIAVVKVDPTGKTLTAAKLATTGAGRRLGRRRHRQPVRPERHRHRRRDQRRRPSGRERLERGAST